MPAAGEKKLEGFSVFAGFCKCFEWKNRRETRFRAPQAQIFSPAALKNRIFGLFLIILKIDFLRKPLFLRKPPLLVPNLERGGAFLKIEVIS